jgi:hypothetical protein
MDQTPISSGLKSNFSDLKDALHDACAVKNHCSHRVTRDKKRFKSSELNTLTPLQFLKNNDS